MKKIFIAIGIVVVIALVAIFSNSSNNVSTTGNQSATTTGTQSNTPTVAAGGNPPSQPQTAAGNNSPSQTSNPVADTRSGIYKDGSYTGPVADAIYGQIQVVAVIQGGKLASVQVPVYPTDGGHTTEISQQSIPVLKQEAIQSQSANVNIVSGATQTSQAFQQSLAAALAMAR